jgi:DNA polymerase-3 subunit delta'
MGSFLTRGQAPAVSAAGAMLRAGMPQALLLVGPPSVGKTTLGLDIAAALLCQLEDAAARPCRECRGCRLVEHGNHPDLHRLAPDGPGGQIVVDQVRGLIEETALLPVEGGARVALVEAAHRLNEDGQNILLKTLEEPPAGLVIVLAAEEDDLLLPTVRSRAARIRLGPVPGREIEALLVDSAVVDAGRAARIARLAGGRPGLAMAYARSPDAVAIRGELSRSMLDLVSAGRPARLAGVREQMARAADLLAALAPPVSADADDARATRGRRSTRRGSAAAAGPAPAPAAVAASAGGEDDAAGATPTRGSAAERRRAAAALLAVWREVATDLVRTQLGDPGAVHEPDLLEEYAAAARTVPHAAIVAFLGRIDAALERLNTNANSELVLDVAALAIPRPAAVA